MSVTFTPPLAALTTIFTPPCSISWLLTTTKVPSQIPPFPTTGPSSCDPPLWATNIAGKGFQYYSPAICPSGFVVGPSCGLTTTRTAQGFPNVQNGETVAYCVPSGQTCTTDVTDFRGGVWGFTRGAPAPAPPAGGAIVTAGPALQIRWRDQDLSILETHPLTPGLRLAGPATSAAAATSTSDVETTTQTSTVSLIPGFETVILTTVTTSQLPSLGDQDTSQLSGLATQIQTSIPNHLTKSDAPFSSSSSSPVVSSVASPAGSSSINSASIAGIALSGALISIVLSSIVFLYLRRYRQSRTGQQARFLPVGVGVWVRRGNRGEPEGYNPTAPANGEHRKPNVELGSDGVVAELGQGNPIGTKENPAELDSSEALSSFRWSWMSHVSRILSTKSRALARSSSATSSSARWTRSAASDRTFSSGHYSGDWEAFARERWPDGLTVPAAVYEQPLSPVHTLSKNSKSASPSRVDAGPARLSRVSGGTFGAIPRSPLSEQSNSSK